MKNLVLSDDLSLTPITLEDQKDLKELMSRIYPPVYDYLWTDNSEWYLNHYYNSQNLSKELAVENSLYCFVIYKNEPIGIIRVLDEEEFPDNPDSKASKLHRIYLDPRFQGTGIGSLLLNWIHLRAEDEGKEIIWLEAMDSQPKAIKFYEKAGYNIGGTTNLPGNNPVPEFKGMIRMWKEIGKPNT
jgi:diamine N-acetyltransferase